MKGKKQLTKERLIEPVPVRKEISSLDVYGVYNVYDMASALVKILHATDCKGAFYEATSMEDFEYEKYTTECDPSIICSYSRTEYEYILEYNYLYKMWIHISTIRHNWFTMSRCGFNLCSGWLHNVKLDELPEPFYKLEEWCFATYDKSEDKFYAAERLPEFVRHFIEFVSNYRYKNELVSITKEQFCKLTKDYLKIFPKFYHGIFEYIEKIKKENESDPYLLAQYNGDTIQMGSNKRCRKKTSCDKN